MYDCQGKNNKLGKFVRLDFDQTIISKRSSEFVAHIEVNSISFYSLEFHFLLNREAVGETDSLK